MLKKAHQHIYYLLLLLFAVALPTSKAAINVLGGALFVNWILEWNWKEKWALLKENRLSLVFGLFFLAFAYGFISTDDVSVSLRAWVSKIPFLLPIVIATTEKPDLKRQKFLMLTFSITVTVASVMSLIILQINGYQNIRECGLFISHIRFSICAVLAILMNFLLAKQIYEEEQLDKRKHLMAWLNIAMAVWCVVYLFVIQVFTGIILLFLFVCIILAYYLFARQHVFKGKRWIIGGGCVLLLFVVGWFIYVTIDYFHYDKMQEKSLPVLTAAGNPYVHDVNSYVENGHKVGLFVCEEELRASWQQRSAMPYDSVRQTLIRYLNSKGQTKDAAGVSAMSNTDVHRVESGMANVAYAERIGLRRMLYPTYFCFTLYERDGIFFNSSVLQRVELWKNSWVVFKERPWTGYGLGRSKAALNRQLDRIHSPLRRDMGCHNQFLTYLLTGGIPLLLAFLLFFASPLWLLKEKHTLFYCLFWMAIFLSLFAEDTLETGTGLYLYLFFSSFLLFNSHQEIQH